MVQECELWVGFQFSLPPSFSTCAYWAHVIHTDPGPCKGEQRCATKDVPCDCDWNLETRYSIGSMLEQDCPWLCCISINITMESDRCLLFVFVFCAKGWMPAVTSFFKPFQRRSPRSFLVGICETLGAWENSSPIGDNQNVLLNPLEALFLRFLPSKAAFCFPASRFSGTRHSNAFQWSRVKPMQ